VLNGIFFAKPLNEMRLLTLPDLFARKFGPAVEVLFSVLAIVSFLCLLGGNLVGCGRILSFVFDISIPSGVWIATSAIWLYTVAGGLIAVAYTDVGQACVGWIGLLAGAGWVMRNMPTAAGNSPAYPIGDVRNNAEQMTDPDALDPIPNAIFFNWVTIFVLGFGNLAALDFQARVFSAKTPMTAVGGCLLGGVISWIIGCTFSHVSGAARALYGPSSPYAEFVADSCSKEITVVGCFGDPGCTATVLNGVPTCGEWKPDEWAPLRMFTCTKANCHYLFDFDGSAGIGVLGHGYFPMNGFIGGWVLISIIAASMSTGDGAILAMSTVFSHNLLRKLPVPMFNDDKNLLVIARVATILWALFGGVVASASPSESGYLLIVAFDIMLAGSVVPMFAAVYWPSCKPLAAFVAMLGGSLLRFILEFALPKDYLLLVVGKYAISFGPGAYAAVNPETGAVPDPATDDWCPQYDLEDWTGLDSLVSPIFSLLLLLIFQFVPSPSIPMFTKVDAPPEVMAEVELAPTADAAPKEEPKEASTVS